MKLYGHMPNGEDVFQVTIESNDLQLKVLSLGAIIQDIRMKNVTHSLVLGYPRLEPYFINRSFYRVGSSFPSIFKVFSIKIFFKIKKVAP